MKTRTRKSWTRLTPEQRAAQSEKQCREFNERFPVLTRVWFWKVLPFGPVLETKVRGEAFVADSGMPVCFVEGYRSYVSIFNVQEVDESRRGELTFVEA
jgi:hypothetical protein